MCNNSLSYFSARIYIYVWILLCGVQSTLAQTTFKADSYYSNRRAQLSFDLGKISPNEDIEMQVRQFVESKFPLYTLHQKSTISSPYSYHILFQQYYLGKPVYQSTLLVSVSKKDGRILSVANNLIAIEYEVKTERLLSNYIFFDGEEAYSVFADTIHDIEKGLLENIYYNGELIYSRTLSSFKKQQDTVVKAKVFFPDPISSGNASYGGNYIDANDSNIQELNDQMYWKYLNLKYDNGYFIFENKAAKIRRLSPVVAYDTAVKDSVPVYGRGDKNFEAINCLYHLQQAQNYIHELQFNLMNYPIGVDPHGRSDDNSAFTNDGQNRYIKFGDGGIDDAEDADPIIHEYHHGVFDEASQSQNIGLYRKSLEEGTCDYMAASYSKKITLNQWDKVYNWDGNTQAWQGRTVQSAKKYPNDLSGGNIHGNGEIWSTFLMNLEGSIGRDLLHSLIYETYYSAAMNLDFPSMAKLLLQSDTLIDSAKNCWKICMHLSQSNILPCGTGVSTMVDDDFKIYNDQEYIYIQSSKMIDPNIFLYTAEGKLVWEQKAATCSEIMIPLNVSSKGVYLLKVVVGQDFWTKKIALY